MGNPSPRPGDLWHRATADVEGQDVAGRSWESVGPHLLTRLMLDWPDHGVQILETDFVDPVAWWNVPGFFLEDRPPPASPFMHMYNSIWHKRGVNPEGGFPKGSLVDRLWRDHSL